MRFFSFFFLLVSVLSATAESLPSKMIIDWSIPLKHEQGFATHAEYAGVVQRGDHFVVALRSGELVVVDRNGRIVFRRLYEGEHTVTPFVDSSDDTLYVATGVSLRALDAYYDERWFLSLRAPLVARPLIDGNTLYVETQDNTVYAIDKKTGKILGSYTSYDTVPIAYVRLTDPRKIGDKIAFGFPTGTLVFFMVKTESDDSVDFIPYFRFKTRSGAVSSENHFFDLFSFAQNDDELLFSNGEQGGRIVSGKVYPVPHMENVTLRPLANGSFLGYGEGGIYRFSSDGTFKRHLFKSRNFVSGLVMTHNAVIAVESGEPTMLARREGGIYLFDKQFSKVVDAVTVPNGFSSEPVAVPDGCVVLTNSGVLLKIIVAEEEK